MGDALEPPVYTSEATKEQDHSSLVADCNSIELSGMMALHGGEASPKAKNPQIQYGMLERPPLLVTVFFSFQQALMTFGSPLTAAFIIHQQLCAEGDNVFFAELLSTTLFMCGVCTFFQVTVGVRIPVIQSSSFSFFPPIIAMMTMEQWRCDSDSASASNVSTTSLGTSPAPTNASTTDVLYPKRSLWEPRMQAISGALISASVVQILLGISGAMGFLMRFIGPLTITPTVALVGLALFQQVGDKAATHWGAAMLTASGVLVCSMFLAKLQVPFPAYGRKRGFYWFKLPVFKLFATVIAISLGWLLCYILTATGQLTSDPKHPQYHARTDAKLDAIYKAKWFYFPYPGQFGVPTFSVGVFVGMLAATASSIVDSIGDYYATARVCAAPLPPKHAVNRGIALEGLGGVLCGLLGAAHSTTSHSGVIGFICITGVTSRWIWQWVSLALVLCGVCGKFGAALATIPDPVIGGLNIVLMGMVISVALSNLQYVDLESSRNLTILGFSMMAGLTVPMWMVNNKGVIQTGSSVLNQVLTVFLSTAMFVGGVTGLILDNIVPGTREERGLAPFLKSIETEETSGDKTAEHNVYDLPYITPFLAKFKCFEYIPCLPSYKEHNIIRKMCCCRKCKKKSQIQDYDLASSREKATV